MRKEIKKFGNSAIIVIDAEDLRVYELKVGDVLDIELCKIKQLPKNQTAKQIKEEMRK